MQRSRTGVKMTLVTLQQQRPYIKYAKKKTVHRIKLFYPDHTGLK